VFEETPHGDWPRLRGHPLFLSYINAGKLNGRLSAWMAAFLFRCPNTGLNVQGWSADEISADEADTYESVTCIACQQAHLVNPATGKVLSSDEG